MRTLAVLLEKEFRQFFRNPFLPRMALMFPMMVMLVMPWVTTMDIRHVSVSVVDCDRSPASRRIVQKIGASDYFTLCGVSDDFSAALRSLEAGNTDAVLEIPRDFGRSLEEDAPRRVSISANGVNATKGTLGMQYLVRTVAASVAELRGERGGGGRQEPPLVPPRQRQIIVFMEVHLPDEEREIYQPLVEPFGDGLLVSAEKVEAHAGVIAAHALHLAQKEAYSVRLGAAYEDVAAHRLARRRYLALRLVEQRRDFLGALAQHHPPLGQRNLPAAADEEPAAELVLKLLDLARKRRLRYMQILRRSRYALLARDGEEILKHTKLHTTTSGSIIYLKGIDWPLN